MPDAGTYDPRVVCTTCGHVCWNPSAYGKHWMKVHWRPSRIRAHPVPIYEWTAEAQAVMDRVPMEERA
jgi:hypothetical protein